MIEAVKIKISPFGRNDIEEKLSFRVPIYRNEESQSKYKDSLLSDTCDLQVVRRV
jgi:hypothetical protein